MPMKPYGLRAGDGQKMASGRGPNRREGWGNSFLGCWDEGGPRGAHKQAKIGAQKRRVPRQGRADGKVACREGQSDV